LSEENKLTAELPLIFILTQMKQIKTNNMFIMKTAINVRLE